ncbi:MAG: cytochrome c [Methyloceanibacter sp.]
MKKVVAPSAKLGGQMVKGVEPFDAAKAAKAMTDISEVPDKYVTLFPKGTEQGAVADSEALPKIWEDFDDFNKRATHHHQFLHQPSPHFAPRQGSGSIIRPTSMIARPTPPERS